jgi:predicted transcriptional regulator
MSLDEYTDTDRTDHEIAKSTIARILAMTTDRDDAVSSKDLAAKTPVSASTVRDLVKEVRREYRMPVVACSNGYYRVTDVDDFSDQMERINDEIATREQTKRELTKAFNTERYG